jgi:ADP-ribosylglycohydrolase
MPADPERSRSADARAARTERILGGLWGAVVGDALGVPVEFQSRLRLQREPVVGMREYGTHGQPRGTWSDDSALLLCTVASLLEDFDTSDLGRRFVRWRDEGYWAAHGVVFDIGGTTSRAIDALRRGAVPEDAGPRDSRSIGNGSLMRILPIALCFAEPTTAHLLDCAHRASRLTHGHPRAQMACGLYCLLAVGLLAGLDPPAAYADAVAQALLYYRQPPFAAELPHFQRLWSLGLAELPESEIRSDGYAIHTLEASVWCLLTARSYAEAVLRAVNLGDDSDTTATVTGGLAGLHWGLEAVPRGWIEQIARREAIEQLFADFVSRAD